MTRTSIEEPQHTFGWWVRHTSRRLPSNAALPARRVRLGDGIEDTLFALRDDHTPLPEDLRGMLGPLRPATYDEAVRLLLWARHAPTGPRCLSYRAALYLLEGIEAPDVEGADLRAVSA